MKFLNKLPCSQLCMRHCCLTYANYHPHIIYVLFLYTFTMNWKSGNKNTEGVTKCSSSNSP